MNILYSFRRCPYAIRARMAILASGITCQIHEVSLRNKPQTLLDISPKATVPVLHCKNGIVIEQSLDIMFWALAQHDPAKWLRHLDENNNQLLLASNDGVFKSWLDRYKYFERYPEYPQLHYRTQAEQSLIAVLEARLEQHPFLGGEQACLIDVAIFPFIRQFAAVDVAWFTQSPWKATRAWLDAWLVHPDFTTVMKKI